MENTSSTSQTLVSQPTEQANVLEQLESYRDLHQQWERFSELLKNAERQRSSVRPAIYERVAGEYAGNLRELEQAMQKEQSRLLGKVTRFLQEREEIRGAVQQTRDRLEEVEFRVRVGEYPEEEVSAELRDLQGTLLEYTRSFGRLEEVLGQFTQLGLAGPGLPESQGISRELRVPGDGTLSDCRTQGDETSREVEQQETWGESKPDPAGASSYACMETADEADGRGTDSSGPQDSFVVLEETEEASDPDCPVVHCPDAFSADSPRPDADQESSPSREASSSFASGYLCALEGSRQGTRFPLICSDITLGKSPGIDIRLLDGGIANFHARIVYKGRKYFLENLDPMGRSFVNGVQADIMELKDGDLIRLGEIKMRVEFAAHATEPCTAQAA